MSVMGSIVALLPVAVEGLGAIASILDNAGKRDAGDILQSIQSVIDSIRSAEMGEVTAEQALKQIKELEADLASNDAAVDAAIDAKFGDE